MKSVIFSSRIWLYTNLRSLLLAALMFMDAYHVEAVGYWSKMPNTAPDPVFLMLQLSDGTVMAANNPSYNAGNSWYRLVPNIYGSYLYGTWEAMAPMNYTRLYFTSQVLTNGKVFVAGAEYGTGGNTAELYDPVINRWTVVPVPPGLIYTGPSGDAENSGFRDSGSEMLPDGKVLIAPVFPFNGDNSTVIYDPVANVLSLGKPSFGSQNEAAWVKLPDDSILTVDKNTQNAERYIPSFNQWLQETNQVPVALFDSGSEEGPGFLLPNGKVIFFGGTGHTAIYTPSGNTNSGTWVTGPDIPFGLTMPDAPACMMANGKILLAAGPAGAPGNEFRKPTSFFEYDYTAGPVGSFTQVGSPTDSSDMTDDIAAWQCTMLALADGTVLYSHSSDQLFVYDPHSPPLAAGKPTINSVSFNLDGSFHLTGTGLNGISEGAAYGDDAQMNGNYPLVRVTDGSNYRTYLWTFNWSSTGVQTGGATVSAEFSEKNINYGFYSLEVVANGIASDPVTFYAPVWVDFNYQGYVSGSYYYPYNTLAAGVSAVATGGTIVIKPGTSHETMHIAKAMNIHAIGSGATIGK